MNPRVFFRTVFLVVLISAVAFAVYANIAGKDDTKIVLPNDTLSTGALNADVNKDNEGDKEILEPVYIKENVIIKISALGDVALGQDLRFNYTDSFDYVFEKQEGNYEYFFSNVADVLSQDDLTIANLETTLSVETEKAEKYDYGNNYWFLGKPEYANILRAGSVEAVNLANNHTYDYGQAGYDSTREALKAAGVEYFGYNDVLVKEIKGIKIGMIGFNQLGRYEEGLDMDVFKKEVKELTEKLRDQCDLLIANFHWGEEYKYIQNALQQELAYLAIDSGADLVIGHHPHFLQPIEKYKGKYICYSLGNFCYGGVKKPKDGDYDTVIYQQNFVFDSDNVLQPLDEPFIYPCSISSSKGFNDYRPKLAVEPQFSKVCEKMNFTPTLTDEQIAAKAAKTDMVKLAAAVKNVEIELKYYTTDNVAGKRVYESDVAYIRKGTADKLDKANKILMKQGYRLKVWDAYRPQKAQEILYEFAKNVFLDPKIGSVHTRGGAVDVTLVDADGNELDMPSGHDDPTRKAYRTYEEATPEQKRNALILENAMKESGFIPLKTEWWHFDDSDYKSYKLLPDYKE
jgi:D-alanyl-D-alanine dipeptidase